MSSSRSIKNRATENDTNPKTMNNLSNNMILLIARTLRDSDASRLKSVSKRFGNTVYAKSHKSRLSGPSDMQRKSWAYKFKQHKGRPVSPSPLNLKRHSNLAERRIAARHLPPNYVSYFDKKTGRPYSKIRPIPYQRRYPFGDIPSRRSRPVRRQNIRSTG